MEWNLVIFEFVSYKLHQNCYKKFHFLLNNFNKKKYWEKIFYCNNKIEMNYSKYRKKNNKDILSKKILNSTL